MERGLSVDDIILIPQYGKLTSRSQAKLRPFIYSAPMDTVTGLELTTKMLELGEYPVVCRYRPEEFKAALQQHHNNPNCFFAVGNLDKTAEFIELLGSLGDEIALPSSMKLSVAVDVAHGDSIVAEQAIKQLRSLDFIGNIMSGSIATPQAARRSIEWGATHLRVGIGPGAGCTTRIKTGCGVPQATAVNTIYREVGRDVEIIADGGIREPGDAVKYLALGATSIMLGRKLATTKESAGWIADSGLQQIGRMFVKTGEAEIYKHYRGQASAEFMSDTLDRKAVCAEGAQSGRLYPSGSLEETIEEFRGGVRSAISYLGLTSMDELGPESVEALEVTPAAYREGTAHGT